MVTGLQVCTCLGEGTAVANSCHFNRSNLLVSSAKEGVPLAWQYDNPACCLHWDSWSTVVVGSSKLSRLTLPAFKYLCLSLSRAFGGER